VLLRAAGRTKGPTEGETMVSLRRWLAKHSAPALERVADMRLMIEREQQAIATLVRLNLGLQRKRTRRTVSIAPVTSINTFGKEPAGQGQPSPPGGLGEPSAPAL